MPARYFTDLDSPVGRLRLEATDRGLASVTFLFDGEPATAAARDDGRLAPFALALAEYFAGRRRDFADLPLDLEGGTAFERAVWQTLSTIPYGGTITYADLAAKVGVPKGFRAVGRANGKNPLPIVVPCHRVVGKGGLGGYSGAPEAKVRLLRLEGSRF